MINLSDIWAPRWAVSLDGRMFIMRPLSLGTFADLEGLGLSLQVIAANDGQLESAHQLFCALAEVFDETERADVKNRMLSDPLGVREFQLKLKAGLEVDESQPEKKVNRRQVNTSKEKEEKGSVLDMGGVLSFSRISGIPLADVSRFSFPGYVKASAWLADNPPSPGLGDLLG